MKSEEKDRETRTRKEKRKADDEKSETCTQAMRADSLISLSQLPCCVLQRKQRMKRKEEDQRANKQSRQTEQTLTDRQCSSSGRRRSSRWRRLSKETSYEAQQTETKRTQKVKEGARSQAHHHHTHLCRGGRRRRCGSRFSRLQADRKTTTAKRASEVQSAVRLSR